MTCHEICPSADVLTGCDKGKCARASCDTGVSAFRRPLLRGWRAGDESLHELKVARRVRIDEMPNRKVPRVIVILNRLWN